MDRDSLGRNLPGRFCNPGKKHAIKASWSAYQGNSILRLSNFAQRTGHIFNRTRPPDSPGGRKDAGHICKNTSPVIQETNNMKPLLFLMPYKVIIKLSRSMTASVSLKETTGVATKAIRAGHGLAAAHMDKTRPMCSRFSVL